MMKKNRKLHSLRMKIIGIHLGVTLACFIVCGALFVMAVSFLVGKYVNHDLDFLLEEVSSNLEQRLRYMEDVIYAIRDSGEMMRFLGEEKRDSYADLDMGKTIDISGSGNQGGRGGPLVEKVYLFREDGEYLSDFYYTLTYADIEQSDRYLETVWKKYMEEKENSPGFHGKVYTEESGCYLLYPVLDDGMNERGVVAFELNTAAVEEIMSELDSYEKDQWILCEKEQVVAGNYTAAAKKDLMEMSEKYTSKPYIGELENMPHRMFSRDLGMELQVTVGIPENQAAVVLYNSLNLYAAGIVAILLAGIAGFAFFTLKLTRPIEEVADKMLQVQTEGFDIKLPDYDNKEFHEISFAFNQMTEYINNLIKQVYEKQISIKEMELKFLQTQMNPHFMFNVLNALALQARIDGNEEICELISTFSKLIQAKIYRSDTEKVKIREELEYVGYYLKIQQFRYGDALSWNVETEGKDILEMRLPKLCIQLLVENALVHGLEPKTGAGRVDIHIKGGEEGVYITVTDDGIGFDADGEVKLPIRETVPDKRHNHVGLNNVDHIIRLMYGEEYGVKNIFKKRGRNKGYGAYSV